MERVFFRPYEGTKPYLFISYAHADSARVLDIITHLKNIPSAGGETEPVCRIWYDQGIDPGSEWPESIARHLKNAKLVVLFLSDAAFRSENCRKEMQVAVNLSHAILCVRLDETPLPDDLSPLLSGCPTVDAVGLPFETAASEMFSSGCIGEAFIGPSVDPPPPPPPPWRLILTLVTVSALIIGAALYLTRSGQSIADVVSEAVNPGAVRPKATQTQVTPTPVPETAAFTSAKFYVYAVSKLNRQDLMPIVISDPVLESAVRKKLSKPKGAYLGVNADMSGITSLILCGDKAADSLNQLEYVDGAYLLDGEPAGRGSVSNEEPKNGGAAYRRIRESLSGDGGDAEAALWFDTDVPWRMNSDVETIACMENLTELVLINQDITNTKPLEKLKKLAYVNLYGNPISSCLGFAECQTIRELNIAHTDIRYQQHLLGLTNLETIYTAGT